MKRFLKRIGIIILSIIVICGLIGGRVYRQSQSYFQEGEDTQTIMIRTVKMTLREGINRTNNPSLLSILQGSYNTLHNYSIKSQSNTTKTKREHVIQTPKNIIQLTIDIPGNIIPHIHTEDIGDGEGMTFSYNEQYLGSLQLYTSSGREQTMSGGIVNMEIITEQSGFIITYSQGLDNPFTGMELEIFSEIAALFNQSIVTTHITKIQQIQHTLGYIQSIQTGENITITIDPIEFFTGEDAAKAREQNDPAGCTLALSGTDKSLCIPENNYYTLDSSSGDSITVSIDDISTIEIFETTGENKMMLIPTTINILQENIEKYKNTFFDLYTSEGIVLQLSEGNIP